MQTLPREDFPTLPESSSAGAGTSKATLPRAVMRDMVVKTQFAITGEDTRYFLNGALFVLRPDSMSLVATDGHRLALVTVNREGAQPGGKGAAAAGERDEVRAILPKKTLNELRNLLQDGDDA